MIERTWFERFVTVSMAALACACAESEPATASLGDSGSVFGSGRPSGDSETARRLGTSAVQTATSSCGGGCSADVASGSAALAEGRMLDAWNAFKCANTPEAAFGAGVARVLGVLESEAGDRVMSDFGLPPLPASDVFGPNGLLGRAAARWNGDAQLTLTGELPLEVESARVMADDWQLEVSARDGTRDISLYLETDPGWTAGTVIAQDNCASGGIGTGTIPYIWLYVTDGDDEYDCSVPYSAGPPVCEPTGGSVHVVSSGTEEGDRVELELTALQLTCSRYTDEGTTAGAPILPQTPSFTAQLTGRVAVDVVIDIDTSDLHPLVQGREGVLLDGILADTASTTFMNHAAGVAGEIASARCYFDKAADGSGTVFTLPGAMYGGEDLALTAADARMLGSAAGLLAATVELGTAYELDVPLQQVACWVHDELGQRQDCPSGGAFVDAVNGALQAAVIRHDRMGAARELLAVALGDFERGVAELDESSALVRNEISAAGWDVALEIARAAQQSLEEGTTRIPHLQPSASVDLRGFFASPPDPSAIMQPLLVFNESCEDFGGFTECYSDIDAEVEYVDAFFGGHTDLDWEGEYEWLANTGLDDAVEGIASQLEARGLMLDY